MGGEGFGDFAAIVHSHVGVFPGGTFTEKGLFGHGAIGFIQRGVIELESLDHRIEVSGKGGEMFALVLYPVHLAYVAAVELDLRFVSEPGLPLGGIEAAGIDGFDGRQEIFGMRQRGVAITGDEGVFYCQVMGNDFIDVFGARLRGGGDDQRYADQHEEEYIFFHGVFVFVD